MNDKKERVYSEEDLCEYTILQKIDELDKQLKNIKNEFNELYETKEAANAIHVKLRQSDAKINNRIDGLYNITPTDVGVKDNKLGLLHDTTWLNNQNAINLDGFTYDESTKTLKVSGGGELTSEALMNVTKDSTTITRTLDTDGKVKFDAIEGTGGSVLALQTIIPSSANIVVPAKTYKAGDNIILFTPFYSTNGYDGETIIINPNFISYASKGALVMFYQMEIDNNTFRAWYTVAFTKDTTISAPINLFARLYRYYIPKA